MRQQRLWMAMGLTGTLFLACPAFSTAAIQTQKMTSHGVASGDVTDTAVVIWTRANQDTTLAVEFEDAETRVVRRTTTTPVRNIKADRPWTVPSVS